ncbi:unnamed protein product [Penicillium salamii]|uniref:Derlin n=1 Tax=Penicillium salamii TaxID=1612424 RepID=A0A9W4IRY2_9EURO|nr:unnamed protein product [Penicillium salamii]CAG8332518.1 unnamed protein product [Penicillium salamii]CAG8355751.1 unnamed protein product [Penicillium salamii]CAG8359322.1 unnamed protein product [Penicillium salamii]
MGKERQTNTSNAGYRFKAELPFAGRTLCFMKSVRLLSRGGAPCSAFQTAFRSASRGYASLSDRLYHELTTRSLPLTYDYLHPQPSHLLNLTLRDLLPSPPPVDTTLPSIRNPSPLPVGHHLIYFPPQVTLSQLLPDCTDTLHTPGEPFNRRLWAGGNLRFPAPSPFLDGSRAVCLESIRNVVVKGREGDEKVIVTIERRVGNVPEQESAEQTRKRIWTENEADAGESSVIENRDLIFMRLKTSTQIEADKAQFGEPARIVKRMCAYNITSREKELKWKNTAPSDATFRHAIMPIKALLFRFSALTFNAHSIHLDKGYTQNEEGYRNLLVHGPLTLTLLLSVVQHHLGQLNLHINAIEYKNIAPLFVEEKLVICGKPKNGTGAWDVWIEGANGGLAVRGTVQTKFAHLFFTATSAFFSFLFPTTFSSCFDPCDQLTEIYSSIMDLFWAAPPVTRTLTALTLVQSALMHGKLLSKSYAVFAPSLIFALPPQIYRLFTPFLLTGPKLEFAFDVYFIYKYGSAMENSMAPGEFFIYLLFVAFNLMITAGWYLGAVVFTQPMIMAFIYSYSQLNRGQRTHFMFIDIPVVVLPYAMLLITMVVRGWQAAMIEAMGIPAAHLYNFLTHIYPVYGGGRNFLTVPAFVERYFKRADDKNRSYGWASQSSTQASTASQGGSSGSTSGSSWGWTSSNSWKGRGAGRRLGG